LSFDRFDEADDAPVIRNPSQRSFDEASGGALAAAASRKSGESDDITTRERVFDAEKYLRLVPSGHIGLFMGSRTLKDTWPEIAQWIGDSCQRRR
jgi:hypothetical protein